MWGPRLAVWQPGGGRTTVLDEKLEYALPQFWVYLEDSAGAVYVYDWSENTKNIYTEDQGSFKNSQTLAE